MRRYLKKALVYLLVLCMANTFVPVAFAGSSLAGETQTYVSSQAVVGSACQPEADETLAFVPSAVCSDSTAMVTVYVNGIRYEGISVKNYSDLLALAENSGLSGKKSVTVTGVMEYQNFDAADKTIELYDAIVPNTAVVVVKDAYDLAALDSMQYAMMSYGSDYGRDSQFTFDHGYGVYLNGFYTEVADDAVFYGLNDDGTMVILDEPVTAVPSSSYLAVNGGSYGFEISDYRLAAVSKDSGGAITALYYGNSSVNPDSTSINIDLTSGNSWIFAESTLDTGAADGEADLDEFAVLTADEGQLSQNAIYLFSHALVFADGSMNTYEPLQVSSITKADYDVSGRVNYAGDAVTAENDTSEDTDAQSIVMATNGAEISVDYIYVPAYLDTVNGGLKGVLLDGSHSLGLAQDSGYNAMIYAINGGKITVGQLPETEEDSIVSEGTVNLAAAAADTSYVKVEGNITNGVFASAPGYYNLTDDNTALSTAEAYLYNTVIRADGWNSHAVDATHGGYVYLEDSIIQTGYPGSWVTGSGSGLTTDTGDGMIHAVNSYVEVFGSASAGMYIIGNNSTGIAENCTLISWADSGAVATSGGKLLISDSSVTGKAAYRNRGGSAYYSVISDSSMTARNSWSGETTLYSVEEDGGLAGEDVSFQYITSSLLKSLGMYDKYTSYTYATYEFSAYGDDGSVAEFRNAYGNDSQERCYDNTLYMSGANSYMGKYNTDDFADVPYLWVSEGALVSAVMEFEASNQTLYLSGNTYSNVNGDDYNFLIAAETGSQPTIYFTDHDDTITGIIWNEGDVTRANMGMPTACSSSITVSFENSDFSGVFADGDYGLWEVDGLSYTNSAGELTSLNGNYYGGTANGGISASFDENSVWTVTRDSYLGYLTLASEACVTANDAVTVSIGGVLVIGEDTYVDGTVTVGNVTFVIDSTPFGTEDFDWEGDYTITYELAGAVDYASITGDSTASYGETYSFSVSVADGYDVAYITAGDEILGAAKNQTQTAAYSASNQGQLTVTIYIAPVYGSDVWSYEDNGDGTITITNSIYNQTSSATTANRTFENYIIVPASIDGKTVTGFGGDSTVIDQHSITTGTDGKTNAIYSLTFQSGMTTLNAGALMDLNRTAVVVLPDTLTAIDPNFAASMPNATFVYAEANEAAAQWIANSGFTGLALGASAAGGGDAGGFDMSMFGPPPGEGGAGDAEGNGAGEAEVVPTGVQTAGKWSYTVSGDSQSGYFATITKYSAQATDSIVMVPGVLGGFIVNAIADGALDGHSEIVALYLPDGITDVSDGLGTLSGLQVMSTATDASGGQAVTLVVSDITTAQAATYGTYQNTSGDYAFGTEQYVFDAKLGYAQARTYTIGNDRVVVFSGGSSDLPFSDVSAADWYYEVVQYVYHAGLMTGTAETVFAPNQELTCGMLITILYRMDGEADTATAADSSAALAWANANGIVSGIPDGTFVPEDSITREQIAVILCQYAKYKGLPSALSSDLSVFSDGTTTSAWAETAMEWAVASGLFHGDGGNLNPINTATRAEAAALLMRFVEATNE